MYINFMNKLTNKKTLLLSIIVFILFMSIVLPVVSEYTASELGSSSPDTSILLSKEELYDIAEEYGESGRNTYITLRFTFDIIWPVVYFMFLAIVTNYFIKEQKSKFKLFALSLPLMAIIFDYAENIFASIYMLRYPLETNMLVSILPYVSLIKWLFVSLSFLLMMYVVIRYIFIKQKKDADS